MEERTSVLGIVREDILRILGEREEKVSLESIRAEIKVSRPFVSEAIKDLEKEDLIQTEGDLFSLTNNGRDEARDIVRKHLVLEQYFERMGRGKEAHSMAHVLEHYVSEEVIRNIKQLSTFEERGVPLTELKSHRELVISDIAISDNELFERIVSMGVFPGERIRVIGEIRNVIVVEIGNKKLALDKDIAKEIKVLEYDES